jgi:hypothetical protein
MYDTEGLATFRKGLAATVLRDFIWGSLYFPAFVAFRHRLLGDHDAATPPSPAPGARRALHLS